MQSEVKEKPMRAVVAAVQLPNVSDVEFEASLTELRELQLRGNGLRELPESIGKLTKLRVLDLEANCLWRLPESLANCTELRVVNLTNNPYSYLRSSFGGWNKVRINGVLTESKGLAKRRAAEQRIFVEGVYDSTH